ncbi:hypothetical protein B0O99DRAFT_736423 [Bisporella sp. PMI_857]|nr:hypothetical protein B0O99DRAFT_736423 [Bisporella sp. PMI_857]
MGFYHSAFYALISCCALMTYKQYYTFKGSAEEQPLTRNLDPTATNQANAFTRLFLVVYCLVMASDWLQGPYVYSLYKDQFGLHEELVAALFTTGFLSAGVAGYFVGSFADKYGRKTACLLFCVAYSAACFCTLVPNIYVLFLGRIFGGLGTSLLYSAFEGWMVTEYHQRRIDQHHGNPLRVVSEWLVEITKTKRSPFIASATLLSITFIVISSTWNENYGDSHQEKSSESPQSPQPPATNALQTILLNKRILTLGLASCFFEGSMYLFVFFWTPALAATQVPSSPPLPLGMIFACFMASVMLGSLIFNTIVSKLNLISHSRLLTIIFATASSSLLIPILTSSQPITFWAFCVFEACVGMYWPSLGYLKGRYIEDGMRARVYGILRVPLNVFVVVALSLIKEGPEYRNTVFMACSGMLVAISGVSHYIVRE